MTDPTTYALALRSESTAALLDRVEWLTFSIAFAATPERIADLRTLRDLVRAEVLGRTVDGAVELTTLREFVAAAMVGRGEGS